MNTYHIALISVLIASVAVGAGCWLVDEIAGRITRWIKQR